MEGNLYHLIKTRKGRPLAGGLVCAIFQQIVSGLDHIHCYGYFHRDMKPENVLVTTTGLHNYVSVSPIAPPGTIEADVVAIIKLADFGLARETRSSPPYTEYVSTRWYRAPEVLLLSRTYSNPVDMWALGTIMAELVNLRPLFPGSDQIDQVARICEILGDPSDEYGLDSHQGPLGGGAWQKGIKMAKAVGFQFPKIKPRDIHTLFEKSVPLSLIHCIRDLLKYDPDKRLTSRQCLEHAYLRETIPRNNIPIPSGLRSATTNPSLSLPSNGRTSHASMHRGMPVSHTLTSTDASHPSPTSPIYNPHTQAMYPSPHSSGTIHEERRRPHDLPGWTNPNGNHLQTRQRNSDSPMDISPMVEHPENHSNHGMGIQAPAMTPDYRTQPQPEPISNHSNAHSILPSPGHKLGKLGSLSFGRKHNKWGLGGMFGGDKSHLPPLDEVPVPSSSTTSLKRTKSSSTDGKSLRELSPVRDASLRTDNDLKKIKKEAERVQREAEKQRRKLAEKMHREQARAVMQKRNQEVRKVIGNDLEWLGGNEQRLEFSEKTKLSSSGPIRQNQSNNNVGSTLNAAAGRFTPQGEGPVTDRDWRGLSERVSKARRREFDDDHSMSSSDVHSLGRMSSISFATVDSDPGPSRIRNRPSMLGINRMTSMSSLRTSFDDFSPSARSSNSISLEGQLAHDFRTQASVNAGHLTGSVSPPPMQLLSLSPSLSPSISPSPPWIHVQHTPDSLSQQTQSTAFIAMPLVHQNGAYTPFDINGHPPSSYGHSPQLGNTPKSSKSQINPIFKVVSYDWDPLDGLVPDDFGEFVQPPLPPQTGDSVSSNTLPPFSQLDAIAGGEYPPLSPMSFVTTPSEDA
ncbi:hypothetical protein H0H81_005315 [Sphagnurus paluster]|uniref:Protein kinase domain-containing protein n=1 Tax=Sphagnurus paluster TaxID=117069 RepID=A0A9P7K8W9_9AGAR|nr:hypothetical protein H0H81_005315 [Sphagnurus paluster]